MKKLIFSLSLLFGLSLFFPSCKVYEGVQPLKTMNDLSYPFPVEKIRVDSLEIAYVEEGLGKETIIFIHGLGSYLPAWKKNIEELKKDFRCIAIDLPGYGKSSKERYPGSMKFYAETVRGFMDAKGIDQATLAGHSMGGQISMFFALAYPQRAERLMLMAPAGFETFTAGQKDWFRTALTPEGVRLTTPEQIRVNLAYNFFDMPADAEFMVEDRIAMRSAEDFDAYCYIIPKCVQGMVNDPVYDFLDRLKMPVLVVFGENDNLIPNRFLNPGPTEKVARDGAARIPNSELYLIPEAGHFVQFEKSEKVNEIIRAFMKNTRE